MFLFNVQKTGNLESFKTNSTQNENTVKDLDSFYTLNRNAQRTTTPQEDFRYFNKSEDIINQIASLTNPITVPIFANGMNKLQLWMAMQKNPQLNRYYQPMENDPDLKKLILGIMASPFSNQNMTDGEKRHTYNEGLTWYKRYILNLGQGTPQIMDTNHDGSYGDIKDFISAISQASYSRVSA